MSKIGVVAPIYISNQQHLEMAKVTLDSLSSTHHQLDKIAIVNRFEDSLREGSFLERSFNYVMYNDENIVARAWNRGITETFQRGNDYALVINLDIVFREDTIDNLIKVAKKYPNPIIWSATAWADPSTLGTAELTDESIDDAHFSCFLVDRRLFSEIGLFDEGFKPAYHEDADMRYRIRLKGAKMMMTRQSLFFHVENAVIKGSQIAQTSDFWEIERALRKCLERYIRKWGGNPYHEIFKEPFNGCPETDT